jgi:hypothetical protein
MEFLPEIEIAESPVKLRSALWGLNLGEEADER